MMLMKPGQLRTSARVQEHHLPQQLCLCSSNKRLSYLCGSFITSDCSSSFSVTSMMDLPLSAKQSLFVVIFCCFIQQTLAAVPPVVSFVVAAHETYSTLSVCAASCADKSQSVLSKQSWSLAIQQLPSGHPLTYLMVAIRGPEAEVRNAGRWSIAQGGGKVWHFSTMVGKSLQILVRFEAYVCDSCLHMAAPSFPLYNTGMHTK